MPVARVHRFEIASPDDCSGLIGLIERGAVDPKAIIALIGKTEGNGCVNDFTRAFAVSALKAQLSAFLPGSSVDQIVMVMSGGTEGALSPHMLVIERLDGEARADGQKALAVGRVQTAHLAFEELGRVGQVQMVADGVARAMADAGIGSAEDVHFVQIKCPLLTSTRVAQALVAGKSVATKDTLKSMGLSRGASALGVAQVFGEVSRITNEDICVNWSAYSNHASTSGGVELTNHEIVVLGMSTAWGGDLLIDHTVMADQIDVEPVRALLSRLGFGGVVQVPEGERSRLVALLAKAEAGSTGQLRGYRHTMLEDSDLSSTRHARGFVGGALAALVGHGEIFVSGGAEHQGPDGGGPVVIIARRKEESST